MCARLTCTCKTCGYEWPEFLLDRDLTIDDCPACLAGGIEELHAIEQDIRRSMAMHDKGRAQYYEEKYGDIA